MSHLSGVPDELLCEKVSWLAKSSEKIRTFLQLRAKFHILFIISVVTVITYRKPFNNGIDKVEMFWI